LAYLLDFTGNSITLHTSLIELKKRNWVGEVLKGTPFSYYWGEEAIDFYLGGSDRKSFIELINVAITKYFVWLFYYARSSGCHNLKCYWYIEGNFFIFTCAHHNQLGGTLPFGNPTPKRPKAVYLNKSYKYNNGHSWQANLPLTGPHNNY